jgi:hypothetical protein
LCLIIHYLKGYVIPSSSTHAGQRKNKQTNTWTHKFVRDDVSFGRISSSSNDDFCLRELSRLMNRNGSVGLFLMTVRLFAEGSQDASTRNWENATQFVVVILLPQTSEPSSEKVQRIRSGSSTEKVHVKDDISWAFITNLRSCFCFSFRHV